MGGVGKALTGILSPVGDLFKTPKAPTIAPTPAAPVTPDVDDTALMQSRRRAAATIQNRSGRSSTMLSNGSDSTGNNKLGS